MNLSKLTTPFGLVVALLVTFSLSAQAWDRGAVQRFATLPAGATNPEGVTVDGAGNVYVSTFAVGAMPGDSGQIFVFRKNGKLIRRLDVVGSSPLLLELAFHPITGDLLVIDFGNQTVWEVDPFNGSSSVFATIPGGPAAAPNVLTFDSLGNVYISDSFQGIIWRTDQNGFGDAPGVPSVWIQDDLLTTMGVPPFGANGIAFNNDESALFVANTGDDTVVRIPVEAGGTAGPPAVFVNSVNGADGLIIDEDDNLWIAANQSDEIVVLDPAGRVIAKLGDFGGLTRKGAPIGLLFPASLVRSGNFIYVTNLALDLRPFGPAPPVDAFWAADVQIHTVSRIRARIPRVRGLPGGDD
jgi:sugar lactone lactonase YvrE